MRDGRDQEKKQDWCRDYEVGCLARRPVVEEPNIPVVLLDKGIDEGDKTGTPFARWCWVTEEKECVVLVGEEWSGWEHGKERCDQESAS
jgi:hypothetical protein